MENELPQPTPQPPDLSELRANYESLYQWVIGLMLLLVVVSGTFWIFMRRQVNTTGSDLAQLQLSTTNMVTQFRKNEPVMNEIFTKFQEFGRTNADFLPFLAKYGLKPGTSLAIAPTNRPPPKAPAKK